MEWLDDVLKGYEEKEKEDKLKKEKAKQQLEQDVMEKSRLASQAIDVIFKGFHSLKRELQKKKYPSDAQLDGYHVANTGEQINSAAILFVRKRPLGFQDKKLSQTNSPYLLFRAQHLSDKLLKESRVTEGTTVPERSEILISAITSEYVDGVIKEFLRKVFAT